MSATLTRDMLNKLEWLSEGRAGAPPDRRRSTSLALDLHQRYPPYERGPRLVRYGVAVAAVGLALLVQLLLSFLLADGANSYPFMVFFAAIMIGAYFGGLRPGLLATALSTVLAWYFFLSPQYSFQLVGTGQGLRLVLFALEGAVISFLVGALHSARRRAEASARQAEEDRRRLHESEERYRAVIESPPKASTWSTQIH